MSKTDLSSLPETSAGAPQGASPGVPTGDLVLLRRLPIDFRRVAEESGFSRGKLCYSPAFGWGVQKIPGSYGVDFACITAPTMDGRETSLRIVDNHWCFYGPAAPTDQQENAASLTAAPNHPKAQP